MKSPRKEAIPQRARVHERPFRAGLGEPDEERKEREIIPGTLLMNDVLVIKSRLKSIQTA